MRQNHKGYRLIWENSAPAPFESGWSIFAKLILLNGLRANHISSLISNPNQPPLRKAGLNFRHSNWIDFQRFSDALCIEQERLRSAFLDELGFPIPIRNEQAGNSTEYKNGIKHCSACLAMGYHCVLFELGFIDTCPWHRNRLESACTDCVDCVLKNRLFRKYKERKSEHSCLDDDWNECRSKCQHLSYSDGKTSRSIQFGLLEQRIIAKSGKQLLDWCQKVSNNPSIAHVLFHSSFSKESQSFTKFFNAAEEIAGPCPWPTSYKKMKVRSHHWLINRVRHEEEIVYAAARNTKWGKTYRSIRRQIFNRYVRQHRSCWNELSNYHRVYSQRLDSDTVCPVALAYASWRLINEKFITTEAFKIANLRSHPIRVLRLDHLGIEHSLNAFACIVYAQFFYIWEEILSHAGICEVAIQRGSYVDLEDFALTSSPLAGDADQRAVIIPDHRNLVRQSFANCLGRVKQPGWMIFPGWVSNWHLDLDYQYSINNNVLYKLRKQSQRRRSNYYYYVTIS